MLDQPNVKLCECGCGQPAEIATKTRRNRGMIKGLPRRFAAGHNRNGRGVHIEPPNPSGLCQCGCGQTTPIARQSSRRDGHVGGEHIRFVYGHGQRGGDLSPVWKAEGASYSALHKWLASNHPKTGVCEKCGETGHTEYAFLHHPEPHTRNRDDYAELCTPCHRRFDMERITAAAQRPPS